MRVPLSVETAERQLATLRELGASAMTIAIAEKVVALAALHKAGMLKRGDEAIEANK